MCDAGRGIKKRGEMQSNGVGTLKQSDTARGKLR